MHRQQTWYPTVIHHTLFAVWLALGSITADPNNAEAQSLDAVVIWNRVLLDAIVVPGVNPSTVFVHRPMAIVSVAVFDAANSFDRLYLPYATLENPAPGASRDAAVAQAAHDTLVVLLPSLRQTFDAALTASLAGIGQDAAREGSRVGAGWPGRRSSVAPTMAGTRPRRRSCCRAYRDTGSPPRPPMQRRLSRTTPTSRDSSRP